ncbi:MAG TPA: hypothetical protein VGO11_24900 [Chthoniobacteraceae bacterium]|jgi:DNA-binding IclR family transcriptional regulator|nr:hypothetical protein [Chthoniobacteraceae bacterium]
MRQLKLVGRELSVVRAIEHHGSTGQYLHERTGIEPIDLHDILNAMIELGYVEAYLQGHNLPTMEQVPLAELHAARFEINPSYYLEIKKLLLRR